MLERYFADILPVRFEQFASLTDESWTVPHHQLLWSQERDFVCSVGERASGVPRNGLLMIRPNQPARLVSGDRTSIRCLRFNALFLQPFHSHEASVVLPVTPHGKSLLALIQSYRSRTLDSLERIRLSCLLFALLGACLLLPQKDEPPSATGIKRNQRHKSGLPIVYAVRYMRKNLANPDLSLNEIAASVGYNPNYFCQEFGQIFGVSPIRHLNELRVDKALRMLEESDELVQSICRDVGIRHPGHLTTMIKNKVGMTPMAYRRSRKREL